MINGWGDGLQPKKPKTTANFKFGTVFSVFFGSFRFPFWPILTGLMGSDKVVLVGYNSFLRRL